jgi:hypothetical protein
MKRPDFAINELCEEPGNLNDLDFREVIRFLSKEIERN